MTVGRVCKARNTGPGVAWSSTSTVTSYPAFASCLPTPSGSSPSDLKVASWATAERGRGWLNGNRLGPLNRQRQSLAPLLHVHFLDAFLFARLPGGFLGCPAAALAVFHRLVEGREDQA